VPKVGRQQDHNGGVVLVAVENAVQVEPIGEFELKRIRRPLAAYSVVAGAASKA
jgi:hypothetical protein